MTHTITLLTTDNNTEELKQALEKITTAYSCVLGSSHEQENADQNYEICQAESTLSVEANKIVSVAEGALLSCCCK
ncbi:reticulate body protein Rbp-7 [Chlamydia abortus]|uniref:reticulate body protein Rbp-7 n=1 Tax=Chlamydia abortus TaxID=83555 RepID=UPI0011168B40|nr:reticulate body protein Rbp-7 [Chlamydia abortus]